MRIGRVSSHAQGGRQTAAAFARKHMLSTQTLEMLADMRQQFAAMLADIGFVSAPKGALSRGRGSRGGITHWVDDRKAAWNTHAPKPAVVRSLLADKGMLDPACLGSVGLRGANELQRVAWISGGQNA